MSERYKPRQLYREWAARLAAGEQPRSPQQAAIEDQAVFERRTRVDRLVGAPRVVHCNHNVPWLDCRICSKPRSPR